MYLLKLQLQQLHLTHTQKYRKKNSEVKLYRISLQELNN